MKAVTNKLDFNISSYSYSFPKRIATNLDIIKNHFKYRNFSLKAQESLARRIEEEYLCKTRFLSSLPGDKQSQIKDSSESLAIDSFSKLADKNSIDAFIFGSTTPTRYSGSHSCAILGKHALSCEAYDIKAGCSTSLVSLHLAQQLLTSGHNCVATTCAETLSQVINPESLLDYFGLADGAASLVLRKGKQEKGYNFSLIKSLFGTDGTLVDAYTTPGTLPPTNENIKNHNYTLKGDSQTLEVNALKKYCAMTEELLGEDKSIDYFIPHQINRNLILQMIDKTSLKINKKLVWHSDEVGNIGGASITYSVAKLLESNQLNTGDKILLMSVGGGLTFAGQVWQVI